MKKSLIKSTLIAGIAIFLWNSELNGQNKAAADPETTEFISTPIVIIEKPPGYYAHLGDAEKFQIQLYPNPATEYINIKRQSEKAGDLLEIYSITGSLVRSEILGIGLEQRLEISELPRGFYFARLNDEVLKFQLH